MLSLFLQLVHSQCKRQSKPNPWSDQPWPKGFHFHTWVAAFLPGLLLWIILMLLSSKYMMIFFNLSIGFQMGFCFFFFESFDRSPISSILTGESPYIESKWWRRQPTIFSTCINWAVRIEILKNKWINITTVKKFGEITDF